MNSYADDYVLPPSGGVHAQQAVTGFDARVLMAFQEQLSGLRAELAALRADMQHLKGDYERIATALSNMGDRIDKRIDSMETGLEENYQEITENLHRRDAARTRNEDRISKLEHWLSEAKGVSSAAKTALAAGGCIFGAAATFIINYIFRLM